MKRKLEIFYITTISGPTTVPSGFISGRTGTIIDEIVRNLQIFNRIEPHSPLPKISRIDNKNFEQYEFGDFVLDESDYSEEDI